MCGCRILSIWTGGLPGNTQKQRIIRRQRKKALEEMVRQAGECRFDKEGYIQKGVIVRHFDSSRTYPGLYGDSFLSSQNLWRAYLYQCDESVYTSASGEKV